MLATGTSITGELKLLQPGPCALLQDAGRQGLQHLGYSPGGALDEHAFRWANKLLANASGSSAIEITLGPFSAEFNTYTSVAITGAASNIFINENPCPSWTSVEISPGDRISFSTPHKGMRTYLAVKGGFNFQSDLSSASMITREKSGPFDGQFFRKGHCLRYPVCKRDRSGKRATPNEFIPDYNAPLILKVLLSPNQDFFSPDALFNFFNSEYRVSPNSNRMGYQLEGEKIPTERTSHVLSHGVSFGTIQIPQDGLPIILLKDRQTIGGYPTIGCVTQLDCFALSQKRPGQSITFRKGNIIEAQLALSEFNTFFQ